MQNYNIKSGPLLICVLTTSVLPIHKTHSYSTNLYLPCDCLTVTYLSVKTKAQTIAITGKKVLQKVPETEKKFGLGWATAEMVNHCLSTWF